MSILFDARSMMSERLTGVGIFGKGLLDTLCNATLNEELIVYSNSRKNKKSEIENKISLSTLRACTPRFIHSCIPNHLLHLSIMATGKPTLETLAKMPTETHATVIAPNINFLSVKKTSKLILVAHDLSFTRFPYYYTPKMRLWHACTKPKKLFARADHVVAVSHTTAEDVAATYHVAASRITVMYPGLLPLPHAIPTFTTLPKKYILCVSTLEPRKNIATLIASFSHLANNQNYHDLHLIIVGNDGGARRELLKCARGSPINERIHFLGYVSDQVKYSLMQSAAVFVYPSLFEGFGFPPLEAMQCGVPVISSSIATMHEVLQDAALYAHPHRSQEFALAIDAMLTDSTLHAHFAEKGRRHAAQFTWERAMQSFLPLI